METAVTPFNLTQFKHKLQNIEWQENNFKKQNGFRVNLLSSV